MDLTREDWEAVGKIFDTRVSKSTFIKIINDVLNVSPSDEKEVVFEFSKEQRQKLNFNLEANDPASYLRESTKYQAFILYGDGDKHQSRDEDEQRPKKSDYNIGLGATNFLFYGLYDAQDGGYINALQQLMAYSNIVSREQIEQILHENNKDAKGREILPGKKIDIFVDLLSEKLSQAQNLSDELLYKGGADIWKTTDENEVLEAFARKVERAITPEMMMWALLKADFIERKEFDRAIRELSHNTQVDEDDEILSIELKPSAMVSLELSDTSMTMYKDDKSGYVLVNTIYLRDDTDESSKNYDFKSFDFVELAKHNIATDCTQPIKHALDTFLRNTEKSPNEILYEINKPVKRKILQEQELGDGIKLKQDVNVEQGSGGDTKKGYGDDTINENKYVRFTTDERDMFDNLVGACRLNTPYFFAWESMQRNAINTRAEIAKLQRQNNVITRAYARALLKRLGDAPFCVYDRQFYMSAFAETNQNIYAKRANKVVRFLGQQNTRSIEKLLSEARKKFKLCTLRKATDFAKEQVGQKAKSEPAEKQNEKLSQEQSPRFRI